MALLETKKINFKYPGEKTYALQNISLTIEQGEFNVICGPSGSGKSTLLQLFKREIAPHGDFTGEIFYNGKNLQKLDPRVTTKEMGIVFQDPENQIVMNTVLEELIFGLENIRMSTDEMRKRVAEMAHFFGIHHLLNKEIHLLSGGQKQLINLTSILLMEPKVLLLDEPTAQLDPVAAKDFLQMIKRMNEEFGITVIIVEHRLEEVFPLADRVFVLENGKCIKSGNPKKVIYELWTEQNRKMMTYLPSTALLYLEHSSRIRKNGTAEPFPCPTSKNGTAGTSPYSKIPLTVKEGKQWVNQLTVYEKNARTEEPCHQRHNVIMQVKNCDFQYEKNEKKILNSLSLSVNHGEWLAIVGGNGTGKSTLLKIMAGLERPQRGLVKYLEKKISKPLPREIGYLPQNPKLLFLHDTIEMELMDQVKRNHLEGWKNRLQHVIELFHLEQLLSRHPYDVSGGEMQKIALASILLTNPKVLLLDEPTKGLDPESKKEMGELLHSLQQSGCTIVTVTHDIDFAAKYADRCAMMFQGEITVVSPTEQFFKGNTFYTTFINRITRDSRVPEIITIEEAREKWDIINET